MKSKSAKKAASKTFNKLQQSAKQAAFEKQRSQQIPAPATKQAKGKGRAAGTAAAATATKPKAIYNPYRDGESVLFVGEANFSFAKTWAVRYPNSAKLSIATSYDSESDASNKYSDLQENVDAVCVASPKKHLRDDAERLLQLREMGVTVLFDVDAQKLEKNKQLKNRMKINAMRFDKM